jgi:hypothetical protein
MTLIHPAIGEAFAKIANSAGWESKRDTYFDFVLAHELHGLPSGSHIIGPKVSAAEQNCTAHRAHFVDELIKLVPDGIAQFGKRLTDISRDGGRWKTIMTFADGSTAEADAVIGCDRSRESPEPLHVPGQRRPCPRLPRSGRPGDECSCVQHDQEQDLGRGVGQAYETGRYGCGFRGFWRGVSEDIFGTPSDLSSGLCERILI